MAPGGTIAQSWAAQNSGLGLREDSTSTVLVLGTPEPDEGPGDPHAGRATFSLCLQSSGNVWVTHEEMETLATSTETVSLALRLGLGLMTPQDEGKVWKVDRM